MQLDSSERDGMRTHSQPSTDPDRIGLFRTMTAYSQHAGLGKSKISAWSSKCPRLRHASASSAKAGLPSHSKSEENRASSFWGTPR